VIAHTSIVLARRLLAFDVIGLTLAQPAGRFDLSVVLFLVRPGISLD